MGKGRIVSGGMDGSYTVELLHNRERIDAEITFLDSLIAELESELSALESEREDLVIERNAIASEIDAAVAAAAEGEIPDVEALLVELAQVSAQIQAQDVRIAMIRGRLLEATKRRQMLQAIPADPQQQAWCADFTESLTGEVATVEVPAEGIVGQFLTWRRAMIRPGHSGRAGYSAPRDGQMFHREGQAGYQAYFNAAILPGVQKWRPQYRIGTITAIDAAADTCSVDLQSEDSSAQNLLIDPPAGSLSFAGVPIEYMTCNAGAFETGDRVLVEFAGRSWGSPKVIGFESNPKPCELEGIICTYQDDLYLLSYKEGAWVSRLAPEAANRLGFNGYWRGSTGEVVSWSGERMYWRTSSLGLTSIRGACYVFRESSIEGQSGMRWRSIATGGSFDRELRLLETPELIGWSIRTFITLTPSQRESLPDVLPFSEDGTMDHVYFAEGGGSSYRVTFDGSELAIEAIEHVAYNRVQTGSYTVLFDNCGAFGITDGVTQSGSVSRVVSGSGSVTLNGLTFTTTNVGSYSETFPGAGSGSQTISIACSQIGLAVDSVVSDNYLLRRIIVHSDGAVPPATACILEVTCRHTGDPGASDALTTTGSALVVGTNNIYAVRSWYLVRDGVIGAPIATESGLIGTEEFPAGSGTIPTTVTCAARTCDPQPCEQTFSLDQTTTFTPFLWGELVSHKHHVIPTDATGRYLLTKDTMPGASVLQDGDIGALIGAADHYMPASVIDWEDPE